MSPVIASIILIVEALIAIGILLAAPTALGYGVYRVLRGTADSE